jgi:hypothetical protein
MRVVPRGAAGTDKARIAVTEPFDPRYLDDYPAWSRTARGWVFAIIGVATAVFWIVVGLGLFIALTAVPA